MFFTIHSHLFLQPLPNCIRHQVVKRWQYISHGYLTVDKIEHGFLIVAFKNSKGNIGKVWAEIIRVAIKELGPK